jgi:hypothetical protein
MADDISPVNLPPIASTGDAHDSGRGSNDRQKKNKNKDADKPKDESTGQGSDSGSQPPESREKKSPSSDVEFDLPQHELDRFA